MLGATAADWEQAVVKALKGGDPARLRTLTRDGLALEPIVHGARPAHLPGWRPKGPWQLIVRIDHPDVEAANAQLLADLAGGADGVTLVFETSRRRRGFGLPVEADLGKLLAGVHLDMITLRVEAGSETPRLASKLAKITKQPVILGYDPFAGALRGARIPPAVAPFTPDGRVVHDAGGTEAQELAYVLGSTVEGLRHGLLPSELRVTLVADQNQFATIAKFRAMRILWSLLLEVCHLKAEPARIHAETAWRMMSAVDVNTNILRTTIAAFAAGVGGTNSLSVLPHTLPVGLPDAQARRIARNTQRVLMDESNLWRVADPAAGAGTIETETELLAERAWEIFQGIEKVGGLSAAITSGSFAADVAKSKAELEKDVARRKVPLTGASEFPDLGEVLPPVLAPAFVKPLPGPLPPFRLSEPFERLRARAQKTAPKAFLATLGAIADFTARATWTKNLLEIGGIAAPVGDGYSSLEAIIAAFKASGTKLAVIASSDAVYETEALTAAAALKSAGAEILVIAGKPKDAAFEAALKEAGVSVFLAAGMDVLAALDDLLSRMGA
jgi:methylmalonyl-CoA mutase